VWLTDTAALAQRLGLPPSVNVETSEPKHPHGGYLVRFNGLRVAADFIVWANGHADIVVLDLDARGAHDMRTVVWAEQAELDEWFAGIVRDVTSSELRVQE
jgi:hypothetical protein